MRSYAWFVWAYVAATVLTGVVLFAARALPPSVRGVRGSGPVGQGISAGSLPRSLRSTDRP